MDQYHLTWNRLELQFISQLVEDSGDACASVQRERKRPLAVHPRFNHDASACLDFVRCNRERTILIQYGGAAAEHENCSHPDDFEMRLHRHNDTGFRAAMAFALVLYAQNRLHAVKHGLELHA